MPERPDGTVKAPGLDSNGPDSQDWGIHYEENMRNLRRSKDAETDFELYFEDEHPVRLEEKRRELNAKRRRKKVAERRTRRQLAAMEGSCNMLEADDFEGNDTDDGGGIGCQNFKAPRKDFKDRVHSVTNEAIENFHYNPYEFFEKTGVHGVEGAERKLLENMRAKLLLEEGKNSDGKEVKKDEINDERSRNLSALWDQRKLLNSADLNRIDLSSKSGLTQHRGTGQLGSPGNQAVRMNAHLIARALGGTGGLARRLQNASGGPGSSFEAAAVPAISPEKAREIAMANQEFDGVFKSKDPKTLLNMLQVAMKDESAVETVRRALEIAGGEDNVGDEDSQNANLKDSHDNDNLNADNASDVDADVPAFGPESDTYLKEFTHLHDAVRQLAILKHQKKHQNAKGARAPKRELSDSAFYTDDGALVPKRELTEESNTENSSQFKDKVEETDFIDNDSDADLFDDIYGGGGSSSSTSKAGINSGLSPDEDASLRYHDLSKLDEAVGRRLRSAPNLKGPAMVDRSDPAKWVFTFAIDKRDDPKFKLKFTLRWRIRYTVVQDVFLYSHRIIILESTENELVITDHHHHLAHFDF
jgi:hypothetical protein